MRASSPNDANRRRRLAVTGIIALMALAFALAAALLVPSHPISSLTAALTSLAIFVTALLITSFTMVIWPPAPKPRRRPASAKYDGSRVASAEHFPAQPGPPVPPATEASAEPPRPRQASAAPSPPAVKPARRVELAALTTSGLSGLTVDRGSTSSFEIYAATQVGLQHAKDGQTREDAYAVGRNAEDGWVFLAVADGLGSAHNSHAAAQLASKTALKLMHQQVPTMRLSDAQDAWIELTRRIAAKVAACMEPQLVDELAARLGYEAAAPVQGKRSAPACTMLFVALGPASADGYPLLWGTVGDCELILVNLDSGAQRWLTDNPNKKRGGMVSNVTSALPHDYEAVMAGQLFAPPNAMTLLASDGMAEALRLVPDQYQTLLPQVAKLRPAESFFGELVGFELPGLHDDRTVVAAWPRIRDQVPTYAPPTANPR